MLVKFWGNFDSILMILVIIFIFRQLESDARHACGHILLINYWYDIKFCFFESIVYVDEMYKIFWKLSNISILKIMQNFKYSKKKKKKVWNFRGKSFWSIKYKYFYMFLMYINHNNIYNAFHLRIKLCKKHNFTVVRTSGTFVVNFVKVVKNCQKIVFLKIL